MVFLFVYGKIMSHTKKYLNLWRCASLNIILGLLILFFPFIILRSFSFALGYLIFLSTLSSLNTVNLHKKSVLTFSTSFIATEDTKIDKLCGRKIEKKEFSVQKSLTALALSIAVYYAASVFFGAPVFDVYSDTLYFSVLMTLLTVYPLIWYFFFCDNLIPVLKILFDSKFDNLTESHLHSMALWTVIGAWVGAFPIPLDWDRPWQTWPITCCIGASLGNSAIHLVIGLRLLYGLFRDRRKVGYNRSV